MKKSLFDWYYRLPPGLACPLRPLLYPVGQALRRIAERRADRHLPVRRVELEGTRVALVGHLSDPLRFHFSMPAFSPLVAAPPVEQVPRRDLPAALNALSKETDLLYVSSRQGRVPGDGQHAAFRVPLSVQSVLDLPEDREALMRIIRNRATRKEFRQFAAEGFTVDIRRDAAAGRLFYERFHLPFVRRRHGAATMTIPLVAFLCLLRKGELVLVQKSGETVAGVSCRRRGRCYRTDYGGVKDGNPHWVEAGGAAAIYYFSILRARELGCRQISFGISQPFLDNGILYFKRKWGGRLEAPRNARCALNLIIPRFNRAVEQWLASHPLILHGPNGLAGLTAIPRGRELAAVRRRIRPQACPGLTALYLLTAEPLTEAGPAPLPAPLHPVNASPDGPLTPADLFGPQRL